MALNDPWQESAGYTSKYRGLGLPLELLWLLLKPDPASGKQNRCAKEGGRDEQRSSLLHCSFSLAASLEVKRGTLRSGSPSSADQEGSD